MADLLCTDTSTGRLNRSNPILCLESSNGISHHVHVLNCAIVVLLYLPHVDEFALSFTTTVWFVSLLVNIFLQFIVSA